MNHIILTIEPKSRFQVLYCSHKNSCLITTYLLWFKNRIPELLYAVTLHFILKLPITSLIFHVPLILGIIPKNEVLLPRINSMNVNFILWRKSCSFHMYFETRERLWSSQKWPLYRLWIAFWKSWVAPLSRGQWMKSLTNLI